MSERDDEGDPDGWDDAPRFPGTVLTAGIIWICVGGFALCSAVLNLALAGAAGPQAGGPNPAAGACCPMLIGIAFLVCGFQTVKGTASDTRGNAVGSLLLGGLQMLLSLLFAIVGVGRNAPNNAAQGIEPIAMLIAAVLVGGLGTALIAGGVLALTGRKQYLAWRKYHKPGRKARRRDGDYEGDDDRPRRRRDEDHGDDPRRE